jgi:hypothetical protein
LDYDRYCESLYSILSQCGIASHRLQLSPFVTTPCEDASLADIRMRTQMMEARTAMGKVLSSSRNFPKKRKSENTDQISILIVLDDLANEADCEWFAFQYRGEKEMINDVLVTSTKDIDGVSSVPVPPLSEEEVIPPNCSDNPK